MVAKYLAFWAKILMLLESLRVDKADCLANVLLAKVENILFIISNINK